MTNELKKGSVTPTISLKDQQFGELVVQFDKLLEAVYESGYDDVHAGRDYDAAGSEALSKTRLFFQQVLNELMQ
jgi:hypothetical protein